MGIDDGKKKKSKSSGPDTLEFSQYKPNNTYSPVRGKAPQQGRDATASHVRPDQVHPYNIF